MVYPYHGILYYLAIKIDENPIHVTVWMNLENIIISERTSPQNAHKWSDLYAIPRIHQFIEQRKKMRWELALTTNRVFPLLGDKNVQNYIVIVAEQSCVHTSKLNIDLDILNSELHLSKVINLH